MPWHLRRQLVETLSDDVTGHLLLALVSVALVFAPGVIFRTTTVSFRGARMLWLATLAPLAVALVAAWLGLVRLERGMSCGNFAVEVMRDLPTHMRAFMLDGLWRGAPWIAGTSLGAAVIGPRFVALAQSLSQGP